MTKMAYDPVPDGGGDVEMIGFSSGSGSTASGSPKNKAWAPVVNPVRNLFGPAPAWHIRLYDFVYEAYSRLPAVSLNHESMVDPNEDVPFGDSPVEFNRCQFCGQTNGVTYVQQASSCFTYCMAIIILLLLQFPGLLLLFFCWHILQDVKHHCPSCHNVIKTKGRIRCPECSKDVFTIQIAGCALVLSKRYALIFAGILSMIGVMIFMKGMNTNHMLLDVPHEDGKNLDAGGDGKWENFLTNCGYKRALGNPLRASRKFDEVYRQNNVEWTGRVAAIREGFNFLIWTAPGLLKIEMVPSEQDRDADLLLLFNPALDPSVSDIEVLDRVTFRATLLALGRRGSPHVAQLWEVLKHDKVPKSDKDHMKHSDRWYYRGPEGALPVEDEIPASEESLDARPSGDGRVKDGLSSTSTGSSSNSGSEKPGEEAGDSGKEPAVDPLSGGAKKNGQTDSAAEGAAKVKAKESESDPKDNAKPVSEEAAPTQAPGTRGGEKAAEKRSL